MDYWQSTPEENATLPLAEETDELPKCPSCKARFAVLPYIGFMRRTGFCSPACKNRGRDPALTVTPRTCYE